MEISYRSSTSLHDILARDSYVIKNGAWSYGSKSVLATVLHIPIEEYMFIVIQTLSTSIFYSMVCRFEEPAIMALKPYRQAWVLQHVPILVSIATAAIGWELAQIGTPTFYLGMILAWIFPVFAFLWWVAGPFALRRWRSSVISLIIPTVFLWVVDTIAIRDKVWKIADSTRTGYELWEYLPIEEAIFFAFTNVIVILGCAGFDRATTILYLKSTKNAPSHKLSYFFQLLQASFMYHERIDQSLIDDIDYCNKVLKNASSSFHTSSFLYPENIRQDLSVAYALCRIADDIVDENIHESNLERRRRLETLRDFVQTSFLSKEEFRRGQMPDLNRTIPDLSISRAALKVLASKVPREPFLELFNGLEMDIPGLSEDSNSTKELEITDIETLHKYCEGVASSVAEICTWIMLHDPDVSSPFPDDLIKDARKMGEVLQLVNISRDILTDALKGRTYIPSSQFSSLEDREQLISIGLSSNSSSIVRKTSHLPLKKYAKQIMQRANMIYTSSKHSIERIPNELRPGVYAMTSTYYEIGREVSNKCTKDGDYPLRSSISRTRRFWVLFKSIYNINAINIVMLVGFLLRAILLVYGIWQDGHSHLKYTDVDYFVFSDAASFFAKGGSPYERETYRYTPLLAWMLYPNTWGGLWKHFGKVLFAFGDLLSGYIIIKLLRRMGLPQRKAVLYSCIWTLNPMVAVISTRGNVEGLLGALTLLILDSFSKRRTILMGLWLGLAVHSKIYPFLYSTSLIWAMDEKYTECASFMQHTTIISRITFFFNRDRMTLGIVSLLTFGLLNSGMYYLYGLKFGDGILTDRYGASFLEHTYLYHFIRSDHRHNFSPYHLALYFASARGNAFSFSSLAFIPQLLTSLALIPLAFAKINLPATIFLQTFAFVAFNKVCTSQVG
ncbi:GPI mannosyltransferase 1 [Neolecta irregularis DAH-3]|uniref:Bifunctional lycopene cyclase/phytoene synthase n=1 Tax=Neolecta irregularis (strain DAH-3) TaxID=1198029 RepID=A0A1U7LR57_NEOID|nr:GPI mannosyltransferase 1 [Neolecta irregularis DAH-3]|eukprot:OLL25032.1 GPI mannosyltransferase 1 [Neolecta irregularis DAH-3]